MINLLRGPNRLRTLVGGSNRPRPSFMATLVLGTVSTNGQAGTYTNATVKTYPDWENVLRYAISGQSCHPGCRVVRNLVNAVGGSISENMTSTNYAVSGAASRTATTATFTASTADNVYFIYTDPAFTNAGKTYRHTVELSSATPKNVTLLIFQIGVGTITQSANLLLTSTPTRYSIIGTCASAGTGEIRCFVTNGTDALAGTVTANKWMVEDVTGQSNQNPGEYVSVGVLSAPYHGQNVDGVKGFATQNGNTVASNVVTEATGAAISASTLLGYRSEEARTNLCLRSEAFDNATWVKVNATINATKVVGPDGYTTAQKLEETAINSVHRVEQAFVKAASATTYAASVSAKPAERSWVLILLTNLAGTAYAFQYFNVTTGALGTGGNAGAYTLGTPKIAAQANGYYRCALVGTTDAAAETNMYVYTASADNTSSYLGTAGSGIYIVGAQLEAGSFATSYIPTVASSVPRNLDLDTYPTSGNVNTNNVTISGTWTPNAAVASMGTTYIWGSYVDANNYTRIFHDGTNIIARKRIAGVNTDATKALAYAAGTSYIISARFSASSGIDIFVNGVIGTNNSNTAALQLGATFQLLADGNGVVAGSSELKNDRVYPVALSDAQVAQIPA